ncbi:DUF3168 domain-containing protein [Aquabacter cavernae]|uniref:DUF3168 domain-containing protein n=1 Tax=Aquabacter cavernae TaxID=2496029 RepID=UPI001FE20CE1|nr:DUF3168 domain-containing protein [Aquabacter cavernae]
MSAALALRQALYARLASDAPLLALLGGARVYDGAPSDAAFPFVTLGEALVSDGAVMPEGGTEQSLMLHAYSRAGGRREGFAIAAAVQQALHDAPLALSGHRLANLRATTAEVRRDGDGRTYHAVIRFRAVTEPA